MAKQIILFPNFTININSSIAKGHLKHTSRVRYLQDRLWFLGFTVKCLTSTQLRLAGRNRIRALDTMYDGPHAVSATQRPDTEAG